MDIDEKKQHILNQLEKANNNMPYLFFKFCKTRQYAEDVCKGMLYANTPQYFRDLETRTGKRGQGDIHELISEIDAQDIVVYGDNGKLIDKFELGKEQTFYPSDSDVPIVCFVGIGISEMNILDVNSTRITFKLPFTDEEYCNISEKFGKYCVIISSHELIKALNNYHKENGFQQVLGSVRYCKPNTPDRINAFDDGLIERFLYKNEEFSYQRECRLVVMRKIPDDHYICVNKLESSRIIDSKDLSKMSFQISFKFTEKA